MLGLVGDLLESLKAGPFGGQIVLEFDSIASIDPERHSRRPLVHCGGIYGIELADFKAMLEVCLALGEANEKILESDFPSVQ